MAAGRAERSKTADMLIIRPLLRPPANTRNMAPFIDIVRGAAKRLRAAVANHRHTARDFMGALARVCRGDAFAALTSPASFGPDYRRGHASLTSTDAPYVALAAAESAPDAPNTERLCGSTGIINVGMFGRRLVIKSKWLVRARAWRAPGCACARAWAAGCH